MGIAPNVKKKVSYKALYFTIYLALMNCLLTTLIYLSTHPRLPPTNSRIMHHNHGAGRLSSPYAQLLRMMRCPIQFCLVLYLHSLLCKSPHKILCW